MKVCFIGLCGHSSQAYKYLKTRPDTELLGFAPGSEGEGRTESISPEVPFFNDYKAMLDEIKPDLAVVSPIFGLTGSVIIECARRKIDVFAEKPVATTLEELALVERAVKENNIRFSAMHYLRYAPAFYHAARLVHEGAIGEIVMLNAQKSYKYGTRPVWYGNRSLYGGTIPWVGIHAIDWISYFSSKRFLSVKSVSLGKNPEMAALCQFELEGGAVASANIDFYRPSTANTHGDDRIRCVGTRGVIEVRDQGYTLINENGTVTESPTDSPELLSLFLDGECELTPEEIFYVTRVALLARDSADTGKLMTVED